MLNIKIFQCNLLRENTYIVSDHTGQGVAIDCGAWYDDERQALLRYLDSQHITLVQALCTHGHLDHYFGNCLLYKAFGLKPRVHAADDFLAEDLARQASDVFGMGYDEPTPPLGPSLQDGEEICYGEHQLRVLHTPGHSPGGVTFYCEEEHTAFTGDTLFRMSIGRTDFQRGSWQQMQHSLHHVLALLPPETVVYPGHGPATTIASELRDNPYLQ